MDPDNLNKLLKTEMAHLLISMTEAKDMVIDPDLTKPLDRIAGLSFLKEHGVDKIFKLEPGQNSLPGCNSRIYLVRPRMVTMKYIATHIKTEMNKGERRSYKIVMVPRRIFTCEQILESEGVMGLVTIGEFRLELFPLDTDVLTMELPEMFTSFYLENDSTWLHTVSSSLVNLQRLFGRIPNLCAIGKGAKLVSDLMKSMLDTHKERKDKTFNIGQLFIVDRAVDFVSPLCSPMTYEAMLSESFGIDCGVIDFGSEVTGTSTGQKMMLSSQDEIYSQIRDRHITQVFTYLKNKAKQLQALYDKKNSLKSVGDIKDFVAKELHVLKSQQKLLETYIGASEVILKTKTKGDFEEFRDTEHSLLEGINIRESIAYIEECIHKQFSPILTLRLMCLLSQTQEGLNSKDYKSLKTQFLQSHGFEHLVTLFNLKKLGILTEQEGPQLQGRSAKAPRMQTRSSNYKALNRRFGLVPKGDIDLKEPKDMSYVFSGAYTPLICKLVEQILLSDYTLDTKDLGRLCDGLHYEIGNRESVKSARTSALKTVLVYFLGGCTHSEITALRFFGQLHGLKVIIATTAIVTGNQFLESVVEHGNR